MPDNPYMSQMSGGPGTMYGGTPLIRNQMFDMSGFPGMNGPQGMLLQMMLQPILSSVMGQYGFMGGQFMPTQNMYDHMQATSFFMNNQRAMAMATQSDQGTYYRTMRGVAHMTGTRFGLEQDIAAQSMAGSISGLAPSMAMMAPEFFDRLHGVRGSAAVMSHFMHLGGRYMRDPMTGLTGMSGDSAGALSQRLFQGMYGEGADIGAMRGLGAGEVGRMYDEMSRRGMIGAGISGGGPDGMKAEADRLKGRLQEMAGVVSAMRDIFGDMGRPNAPIPEIFNGLQMLTQGGMNTIPKDKIESVVRNTYNLANMSGLGLDNMSQLISRGAGLADQFGLSRTSAISATQHAVAFAAAYGNRTGAGISYYGASDKERMTMLDQQLQQSAGASRQAQLLNAALYIGDTFGALPADSEAAALTAALRNRQTSYQFGGMTKSVAMTTENFLDVFQGAGVNRQLALNVLASRGGLLATGEKYDTASLARQLQRDVDIMPQFNSVTGLMVKNALPGVDDATANSISNVGVQAAFTVPDEIRGDPAKVAEFVAGRMAQASGGKFSPEQLKPLAASLMTRYEHQVQTNPRLRAYKSFWELSDAHNPTLRAEANRIRDEAQTRTDLQTSFSRLGRIDPLRRMMTILSDRVTGKDDNFGELISEALGGVPADVLLAATGETDKAAAQKAFQSQMGSIRGLVNQYYGATGEADRKRILGQINEHIGTIHQRVNKFYAADVAVTGSMMEDLRNLSKGKDSRLLTHAGDLAERMMLNEGNLSQIGKGGMEVLRTMDADQAELRRLMQQSGSESLGDLLERKDAMGEKARTIYQRLDKNINFVTERVMGGRVAQGDQALTEAEKTEQKRLRAAAMDRKGSDILQDLEGVLGGKVTDASRSDVTKAIEGRKVQIMSALGDYQKLRDAAKRLGIDSTMKPAELMKALQSRKGDLTAEEQTALDRSSPLAGLNALTLDKKALDTAFPEASPGGSGGAPGTSHRGTTNMRISGEVRLKMPNWLVFEDAQGAGAAGGGGRERHNQ